MDFTPMQKQIIKTTEPHVLVSCAAASGKTSVLVERLRYLLDQGIDPARIVAITFTNNAASVMYERLGYPQGLFIGTIHSYCNYLLRGGAVDTTKIIEDERFDDLFPEIEAHPDCLKPVDYLLVDEAQDSTEQQFKFFELVNPTNYMYFYDIRQSIYGFNNADPQYLIIKEHEPDTIVYRMAVNFRNLPRILLFAKKFLYRLGPSYEDDSVTDRMDSYINSSVMERNLKPEEAVDALIRIKEEIGSDWKDWFVLCRTNTDIQLFQQLFEDRGVPTDTFKQADLTNSDIERKMGEDTLKILTVHSAKGLENKYVMAFNIRAYNDEEARLCYVAATRARDYLMWIKMPPKRKKKVQITSWE